MVYVLISRAIIHLDGESRFSILFNPCNANLPSLCPARSGVNITAAHIIPVSQADVSEIPGS